MVEDKIRLYRLSKAADAACCSAIWSDCLKPMWQEDFVKQLKLMSAASRGGKRT